MSLYTTFNLLIDGDVNPNYIADVEGFTGNRNLYGLDTPIRISDIYTNFGLDTAISCFLCTVDTRDIEKAISIEWLAAQTFWDNYSVAATQWVDAIESILAICAQYQVAKLLPGETRYDYCGVPLTAQSPISANQILDQATRLKTFIDTFVITTTPKGYLRVVNWLNTTPTITNGTVAGGPIWDYQAFDNIPDFSASNELIDDAVVDQSLLIQSTAWETQYHTVPPSVPFVGYSWRIEYIAPGATTAFYPDYEAEASYRIGQATVQLAQMVAYNIGGLPSVFSSITSAYASYRESVSVSLSRDVARLIHINETNALPISCYLSGGCDGIDTEIRTAEQEKRAQLLTDLDYVLGFDQDANRRLSHSERVKLEADVKKKMIAARQDRANELYVVKQAELTEALTIVAPLGDIFLAHVI